MARFKGSLLAVTAWVVNHGWVPRRLLRKCDPALKRRVACLGLPNGVRKTLKEATGKVNSIQVKESELFRVLHTGFTAIRHVGGARTAYLMTKVSPGGWLTGWDADRNAWVAGEAARERYDGSGCFGGLVLCRGQNTIYTS